MFHSPIFVGPQNEGIQKMVNEWLSGRYIAGATNKDDYWSSKSYEPPLPPWKKASYNFITSMKSTISWLFPCP